jgi:hypothetical protein
MGFCINGRKLISSYFSKLLDIKKFQFSRKRKYHDVSNNIWTRSSVRVSSEPSYNENEIVKIQSIFRRRQSNKSNIYICLRQKSIQESFQREIKGYHLINKDLINGEAWEELNRNIVKHKCEVVDGASGNHKSGKDNKFNDWNISNKTAKIKENGEIDISSYRLTSVCSENYIGKTYEIIKEIETRDKSFEYYSILLKKEQTSNGHIKYFWCIVPKDYYIFNVNKYPLKKMLGKKGIRKGNVIGWESKYFKISFTMSSQLWFSFSFKEIQKYIIAEVDIDKTYIPKLTYGEIYSNYCHLITNFKNLRNV